MLIALSWLAGCAASPPASVSESARQTVTSISNSNRGSDDPVRLQRLWQERSKASEDFPIGPGDVLEIAVPGIEELKDGTVRVNGSGDISLPLLGEIKAVGLTEEGLRKELCSRLGKFMYHPQAEIFFKSYSSHQVAVTGAVHNPGMYVLNGPRDTLRDVLERAGGMSDSAAQEVILTPQEAHGSAGTTAVIAPSAGSSPATYPDGTGIGGAAISGVVPASLHDSDGLSAAAGMGTPVVIELAPGSGEQQFIDLPMKPGDTVYVPQAGHVTVIGWVYSPKVMDVTPGLTVLGAVAAAGGPLYAGDMDSVKVIRQGPQGTAVILKVDLNRVKKLEDRDVALQANDVIEVGYSTVRLPGYAVYYAAQSIFTWTPAAAIMAGVP